MKIIDKINDKISQGEFFYSFEYFPPKTQSGVSNLIERIDRMSNLNPLFVDMTWGAGGTTSESTLFLSSYIQNYIHLDTLMHITCRCQSKEKLDFALDQAKSNNLRNILVLRGDPPQGVENYDFTKDYFQYAEDLIKYIRDKYKDYFCIAVAGYPATHVDSKNKAEDIYYLKRKIDAGADFIITQLFYDQNEFLNFLEDCKNNDINVPILPGLLPVNNYNSFKKIIQLCKIGVPESMIQQMDEIKGDEEKIKEYGIKMTIDIVKGLMEKGVKGFHFYTMNLEKSVTEVIERMNMRIERKTKQLPWNPRASESTVETVRPIFWSNNEKSYISKTFYWDEFPNGIWGDSRSPAFGNNEEHLHTFGDHLKLIKGINSDALKNLWGTSVTSIQDVSNVFTNFIERKINRIPWAEISEIQDETTCIKDLLHKMNSKGLFTINSQPNANGVRSDDAVLGWGPPDGYVYQRQYIEFFIQKDVMLELINELIQHPNILYQSVNLKGEHYESFKGNVVLALTWGVFPNKEITQPTIYDSEVFLVWKEEAFNRFDEWIKIYNPENPIEVGSSDYLKSLKNELYLMTIVDNDFIYPKVENILLSFLSSL